MEIRKANFEDLETLIENRMDFLHSMNCTIPEGYENTLRSYLHTHLQSQTFICFLAQEDTEIISSVMMSIHESLPSISTPTGKYGYLYNVYTKPPYRRQGISTLLLNRMIQESKKMNLDKLMLDYTDEGYPLYCKLGFQKLDRQMALTLCSYEDVL